MRLFALIVGSMLLGILVGIGSTWASFGGIDAARRWIEGNPTPVAEVEEGCKVPPGGPQPKLVVDQTEHDFGKVESGGSVSHSFSIRNEGGYPLCISDVGTSCLKCTVSRLSRRIIPPGEEAEVVVEYESTETEFKFRHYANLATNDPERPQLTLTVFGTLAVPLQVDPKNVVFTRILAHQPQTAEVRLFAYLSDGLEVSDPVLTDPRTARFFEIEIKPLDAEVLKEAEAKSGVLLRVRTKPGLPSGPLRQTIRLRTNLPRQDTVDVPIHGRVFGNVSIVGEGWNSDLGVLDLGVVDAGQGTRRELQVVVRQPHPEDLQVELGSVTPPWMKVTFGKPQTDPERKLTTVLIVVEVPKDSPPANYLGSEAAKLARIVLTTNVPGSEQFLMRARLAVE